MILVIGSARGYTDVEVSGPYQSLEEAQMKVTNHLGRGIDGDETQYTFLEVTPTGTKELGYVHFEDEYEAPLPDRRTDNFPEM